MRASCLTLNARVTVEVQDKDGNLHQLSIPGTMASGIYFDQKTLDQACEAAFQVLKGTGSVSHTARLMNNRRR